MKVLSISNSFGQDANRYLHQIARTEGVGIDVATLYIGGCPLDLHFRNMISDRKDYTLCYNGATTGFKVSLEEALLSNCYDVITLQQASIKSPKPDTYTPYAQELYDYVKTLQPKAKILIHQTWAYEDGHPKMENMGYASHKEMFADIEKAYQICADEIGADGIIPSGRLLMTLLEKGIEKVHRDKCHASFGLGRYALALLWFRMLTGKSVAENTFCDFDEPVSAEEVRIAKEAVDSFEPIFSK
jgi:hypothetical protein